LGELSNRLGLSERQTQRVIEKNYGSSFGEKKNEARMSAAAILLEDGALSLADVSKRNGYSSREYFNAAFKKYYKISPGRYKKTYFRNYDNTTPFASKSRIMLLQYFTKKYIL